MPVLDARGRRYLEVLPFSTTAGLANAFAAAPAACVECGTPIVHGETRYFQRSTPRPRRGPRIHPEYARVPVCIDFAAVCVRCGERALQECTR